MVTRQEEVRQRVMQQMANAGKGALVGATLPTALLGAGIGGLHGVMDPGYDEEGKRKSRTGSALKRALGYGALGAGAGLLGTGGAAAGGLVGLSK